MWSILTLIAIATVLTMTAGDYDSAFCRKHMGPVDDSDDTGIKPVFYDNFYVFIEIKSTVQTTVIYTEEYFSQQAGLAYGTIKDAVNQTQYWVDAKTDEITTGPLGQRICMSTDLKGSSTAMLMGVTVDSQGNVSLSTPEVAMGWDRKFQQESKYIGSGESRGIKTLLWNICSYSQLTQITSFSEWHLADPDYVTMPAVNKDSVPKPILPVQITVQGIDHSDPKNVVEFRERLDFTFFDSVKSTDQIFQIPTTKLCSTKLSAQVPLPTAPSYFKFRGEQITINNPNSQSPDPPDLVYTVEEYTQLSQIFIQDFISTPSLSSIGNDKSLTRTINDYSTGLSFQMDLTSGSCSVNIIPPSGVDSISLAGGNVQMRTSQQFFDLDSKQYEYMGIHTRRGIDCDTWSAYFNDGQSDHEQNSLYTWYFANTQWMQNNGFSTTSPLPVALEIQQDDAYIQFNIYEFDTQDQMKMPDISLCFDPTSTLNVEFYISASYAQVVVPDVQAFRRAIYAALVKLTSLTSILRISGLDVQPGNTNEIIVRFKLLDIATVQMKGDVSKPQYDAPNSQVYNDLNQGINAGTFSVDITTTTDTGTGKRTVTARRNSVGQFIDGNVKFAASTSSSSYTPGAMAGIGIGMLVVGLILGVVIIFAVKRFREGGNDITRKKLDDESHT